MSEAIRVRSVAHNSADRARTAAINELEALIVTAPDDLRATLRGLTRHQLIETCFTLPPKLQSVV